MPEGAVRVCQTFAASHLGGDRASHRLEARHESEHTL